MTTTYATPADAVRDACHSLGLSARGLTPLRQHATSVFLLPEVNAVARVSALDEQEQVERGVRLTRWLAAHGLPVTEPLDVPQPLICPPFALTLWTHYPQPEGPPPSADHLGRLLRQLHELPLPPIPLPRYRPLAQLQQTAAHSSALSADDRAWLLTAADQALEDYSQLDFTLGHGLLHGDAYPGNTLWDSTRALLGDWDEAAFGPREIDLANTFQGVRFGRTEAELSAFAVAYGYDPRPWPGLSTLTRMRDLHTLGSFIRRADHGDAAAVAQLDLRLKALREGNKQAMWNTH